ncbi:hypothetical protein [Lacimicrobium alkaliphilum]|uniref:Uncharacterized protein n=1 Tax=Lacimicrobium alkaliphilum TaxID=1526571 RepID=A0ABQ1RP59_9ALTE|nr:hypothetical protein [Lacimicrobium alkaliphilum]GGD73467.1 hypothetical protein GCM10011357_30700 [Lacimicrobium alkaliphilum]
MATEGDAELASQKENFMGIRENKQVMPDFYDAGGLGDDTVAGWSDRIFKGAVYQNALPCSVMFS